ncbi:hypothetical protein NDU88_000921 [Pleurodeles waltl]|uniref:Uncharacterized protein n=1 Tax=Pleurodeles waltl TaxID=8319 RepID=A0AAV7V6C8_PLEWA|nr:hypothetical protein NDU88_000921 [Pleurodeles waltl]
MQASKPCLPSRDMALREVTGTELRFVPPCGNPAQNPTTASAREPLTGSRWRSCQSFRRYCQQEWNPHKRWTP